MRSCTPIVINVHEWKKMLVIHLRGWFILFGRGDKCKQREKEGKHIRVQFYANLAWQAFCSEISYYSCHPRHRNLKSNRVCFRLPFSSAISYQASIASYCPLHLKNWLHLQQCVFMILSIVGYLDIIHLATTCKLPLPTIVSTIVCTK